MSDAARDLVRALLETVHDAILVVDETGVIEVANQRAERLFGYAPGQLVGRPVAELVPEALRPDHDRFMGSYLAAPRPRPMGEGLDVRARRADGTTLPIEVALSTFTGAHGLRVSVTVRERAVPDLARATSGELGGGSVEASRLLAQVVSHDINNQLGVIYNATSLMLSELPTGSVLREDVVNIRKAAERATEVTRRLSVFAARASARPDVVDVADIATNVARDAAELLLPGTTLTARVEDGAWHAKADPAHLVEALDALIENAVEAMPRGGAIRLDVSNEDLSGSDPRLVGGLTAGPYVCVSVTDSGVGMSADAVARGFEPFFTTKRGGDVAGLGLAAVSSTAREAGGLATLYSEPGVGTTVRMFFPAEAVVRAATQPAPRGQGERVLLVEDEQTLRALTRLVLRRGGYVVLDASDGDEALQILTAEKRIDLLLTDLGMPGISGRELAVRARQIRPEVRVLYSSGYPTAVLLDRGQLEAGVPLIEKPYTDTALLSAVRAALPA